MGKLDFHLKFQLETKKILCLIGLVLGSVLIIQYFEPPYSLLSSGMSYFNFPYPNRDIELNSENESNVKNNSKTEEGEIISIAPQKSSDSIISPSYSYVAENNQTAISPASLGFAPAPVKLRNADIVSPYIGFTENVGNAESPTTIFDIALAPAVSPSQSIFPSNTNNIEIGAHLVPSSPPTIGNENGTFDVSNSVRAPASDNHASSTNSPPPKTNTPDKSPILPSLVTISDMNDMLAQRRASVFSENPLWPTDADQELLDARFEIEQGGIIRNHPGLYAPIYRDVTTFVRSYEIMEKKLKIYIYADGKRPVFHQPRLRGIYASEGWFMKLLEESNQFVTSNPDEAHLFYLPFSTQLLVDYVYVKDSHTFKDINEYLKSYLNTIKTKYPFWNRTDGADHFLVACHDWAPVETRRIMSKCIRALCNADVKEGFQFGKDVSLPETYVHSPQNPLAKEIGGYSPAKRKILAFFAGQMHGYVRPILLKHWENKDPDMKIFGRMKKGSYIWHMKSSKYCICAKGYEVNSPRVVEAIVYGCVPVIVSDNFVPPFFDVLKWESFAVFVLEKDIPNLKNILLSIPEKRYDVMQHRVKMVRQHFLWHSKPVKYDIFHMILHSVWFNRVFQLKPSS